MEEKQQPAACQTVDFVFAAEIVFDLLWLN